MNRKDNNFPRSHEWTMNTTYGTKQMKEEQRVLVLFLFSGIEWRRKKGRILLFRDREHVHDNNEEETTTVFSFCQRFQHYIRTLAWHRRISPCVRFLVIPRDFFFIPYPLKRHVSEYWNMKKVFLTLYYVPQNKALRRITIDAQSRLGRRRGLRNDDRSRTHPLPNFPSASSIHNVLPWVIFSYA